MNKKIEELCDKGLSNPDDVQYLVRIIAEIDKENHEGMLERDNKSKISDWLFAAGRKYPREPEFPSRESFERWQALMYEELEETRLAYFNRDWEEFKDGLMDLEVVHGNIIHESGAIDEYRKDFDNVIDSLWTKFDYSQEDAENTAKSYAFRGIKTYWKHHVIDGKNLYITYRDSDGKIMKSRVNFKTPQELKNG